MSNQIPCVEMDIEGLLALGERAEGHRLQQSDCRTVKMLVDTIVLQYQAMQGNDISMKRVLRMMFGAATEKTRNILKRKNSGRNTDRKGKKKGKRKGHGRRPASAYWGADHEHVGHPELKSGDRCPECRKANLYAPSRQSQIIRLIAQPLVAATVFELETLRCAGCGKVFSAQPPAEAGDEKYDPNVGPGLAVQRYGYGMPMNRIEQMQEDCVPSAKVCSLIFRLIPVVCERGMVTAPRVQISHRGAGSARWREGRKGRRPHRLAARSPAGSAAADVRQS